MKVLSAKPLLPPLEPSASRSAMASMSDLVTAELVDRGVQLEMPVGVLQRLLVGPELDDEPVLQMAIEVREPAALRAGGEGPVQEQLRVAVRVLGGQQLQFLAVHAQRTHQVVGHRLAHGAAVGAVPGLCGKFAMQRELLLVGRDPDVDLALLCRHVSLDIVELDHVQLVELLLVGHDVLAQLVTDLRARALQVVEDAVADRIVRRVAQELLESARKAIRRLVIDEGVAVVFPHIGLRLRCQRPLGAQVGREAAVQQRMGTLEELVPRVLEHVGFVFRHPRLLGEEARLHTLVLVLDDDVAADLLALVAVTEAHPGLLELVFRLLVALVEQQLQPMRQLRRRPVQVHYAVAAHQARPVQVQDLAGGVHLQRDRLVGDLHLVAAASDAAAGAPLVAPAEAMLAQAERGLADKCQFDRRAHGG